MSLFARFLPLLYTWNFKLDRKIGELFSYLYYNHVPLSFILLVYGGLEYHVPFYGCISVGILFVVCWLCLLISYEIGYIVNDTISVKKEKNSTIRVPGNILPKNIHPFILFQVAFRITLVLGVLYLINSCDIFGDSIHSFTIYFGLLLLGINFVFIVHNFVRKIEINYITFYFLRVGKILLPVLVYLFLISHSRDSGFYVFLSVFLVDQFSHNLYYLRSKLGLDKENIPKLLFGWLTGLTLFLLTGNLLALFLLIYYFLVFFLIKRNGTFFC